LGSCRLELAAAAAEIILEYFYSNISAIVFAFKANFGHQRLRISGQTNP
jgi:hypothetical protein